MSARRGVTGAIAWGAVLLASLGGCRRSPETLAIARTAETLLSDLHARGLFNGAVVLGVDGEIVYEGAWGPANLEEGVPLTPDTAVDGGSLAKNFTAAAVWMLVDEGALDLDAPVQRYVPEYPHGRTTVRHLIEHSAGLADWEELPGVTNAGMVDELRKSGLPPRFAPGSRYEYCNACYDVAALIVERASRRHYETFLRQRVFDPLGMTETFLRPVLFADWPGVRTLSYRKVDGEIELYDVYDNEAYYGSINLYFSARDLHKWVTSLYASPVLSRSAMALALETPEFAHGERSAFNRMGWFSLPGRRSYFFSGHWRGFHDEIYWDADRRLSVVWVSNVLGARPLPPLLTRALIDIVEGHAPEPIVEPDFRAPESGEGGEAIVGSYDLPSRGRVTVTTEGDRVLFQIGDGATHEGYPLGPYTVPDWYARIWFSGMREGRYQTLHWLSLDGVASGNRVKPLQQP